MATFSTTKVVLKTKNEAVLLRRWINHHLNIVGPDGIVIFDNGSTDKRVNGILDEFAPQIAVYSFSTMHNEIHRTDGQFRELYRALQASSSYYTFIDTDEFLFWANADGTYFDDERVAQRIVAAAVPVIPGIWARNHRATMRRFLLSFHGNRINSGIKGGKPVLASKTDLPGFLNHNIHLPPSIYDGCAVGNLIVGHLVNFSAEQRIAANLEKLKSYDRATNILGDAGLAGDAITVDTLLALDAAALPGNYRVYVEELRRLTAGEATDAVRDEVAKERAVTFKNGRMGFASFREKTQVLAFLNDPAPTIAKALCAGR